MKNSIFYGRGALDISKEGESALMVQFPFCLGKCLNLQASNIFLLVLRIIPDPALLAYHFFSVALYAIWIMFVDPREHQLKLNDHKNGDGILSPTTRPSMFQYPFLIIKAIRVVC